MFLGLLVLSAGVLVGWFVFKGKMPSYEDSFGLGGQNTTATPTGTSSRYMEVTPTTAVSGTPAADKGGVATRTVVTYTDSGFAPAEIRITAGSVVTFVNEASRGMWVASAVHPTHQLLPGFDQMVSAVRGGTYEYTFAKVGTWKYHNHMYPSDTATVVVTP